MKACQFRTNLFLIFLISSFFFLVSVKNTYAQTVNCGRGVLGRIVNSDTGLYFQPENDDGSPFQLCQSSAVVSGAEANGTLTVNNRNEGNSDWACNPGAYYSRSVPSQDCGQGPHSFYFSPPTGYTCSDVVWSIDYPTTCPYGCTGYNPPTGAQLDGTGCTATVYLGSGLYDNHLQWFLSIAPTPTSPPTPTSTPIPTVEVCTKIGPNNHTTQQDYSAWSYYFDPFGNTVSGGRSVGDFDCNGVVEPNDYSIWSYYFSPY